MPFAGLLSVIIINYNYAKFLKSCLNSAIGLNWENTEVIFVDDGSTDESLSIAEFFSKRVKIFSLPKCGQIAATNYGFSQSSGDVIIFLDSDDMLHPQVAHEVYAVLTKATSKIQYQLQIVDEKNKKLDLFFPHYPKKLSPEKIKKVYQNVFYYPCPPNSGNAYPRPFLKKVFPLNDCCGSASDSMLLAAAPILGDVITVNKPLGFYRMHPKNQSGVSSLDAFRYQREVTKANQRAEFAEKLHKSMGQESEKKRLNFNFQYLENRTCSFILSRKTHPIENDSRYKIISSAIRGFFIPQKNSFFSQAVYFIFICFLTLSPKKIAYKIIKTRNSVFVKQQIEKF